MIAYSQFSCYSDVSVNLKVLAMKYKKQMKAYQEQCRHDKRGSEKTVPANLLTGTVDNPLAQWGSWKRLQASQEMQLELYFKNDLNKMRYFFSCGGCFEQKVQRQIIEDENLEVLDLFLDKWEFIPTERSKMLQKASLEFIEHYLLKKPLGKQWKEFSNAGRLPKQFREKWLTRYNVKI